MNAKATSPKAALARTAALAKATAAKPAEESSPAEALFGSSILPPSFLIGEDTVQLGTIVAAAHAESDLTVEDWNKLEASDREARLAAELKKRGWVDSGAASEELAPISAAIPAAEFFDEIDEQIAVQRELVGRFGEARKAEAIAYVASERGNAWLLIQGAARVDDVLYVLQHQLEGDRPAELYNLGSHPLTKLFALVANGLEQLPGSERATGLINDLHKLRESTEDYLNGVEDRHRVTVESFRESLAVAQAAIEEAEPAFDVDDFKQPVLAGLDWPEQLKGRLEANLDRMAAERGTTREVVISFAKGFLSGVDAAKAPPATEPLPDEVPAGKVRVRVRGPNTGRWRVGKHFGPELSEPFDVTYTEHEELKADPELTVRRIG